MRTGIACLGFSMPGSSKEGRGRGEIVTVFSVRLFSLQVQRLLLSRACVCSFTYLNNATCTPVAHEPEQMSEL